MTETPTLLPCPFCGGAAHITREILPDQDGIEIQYVRCSGCGLRRAKPELWNMRAEFSAWRDISTAPKDGNPIIVGIAGYNSRSVWWDDKISDWVVNAGSRYIVIKMKPTHWQPLPEPPTD